MVEKRKTRKRLATVEQAILKLDDRPLLAIASERGLDKSAISRLKNKPLSDVEFDARIRKLRMAITAALIEVNMLAEDKERKLAELETLIQEIRKDRGARKRTAGAPNRSGFNPERGNG